MEWEIQRLKNSIPGVVLIELRETQQIQVTSSGTSVDEHAIANKVLRERRGHVHWVGRVPNGNSPSTDSTAASKVPQGTSHQFFCDPQNDDPQFAMYEAQCRRRR
ncbi:hypothetical protein Adt_06105 [Abeliophyllum distichum]|uniref:Uncharacterized protein n=1 Tax=Abeliophyllum distichum TaxID=126358 RepID=A0ABD1V5Y7_9LAMI